MKQTHEMGRFRLKAQLRLSILWLVLVSLALSGQSLQVSSIKGSPGEVISVEISLDAPAGKQPALLKWETVFPAQLLQMEGSGPSPSAAAKASGKSLTCAAPKAYSYVCILAGGVRPVGNGTIATFRFKVRDDARLGTSTITIYHAEGVSRDATPIILGDTAGLITIWSLHRVALNWIATTSARVEGYNVYRSTTSRGPYTKVNSTPTLGTRYTDASVQAGQTYYYVTTSVDIWGNESEYSGQVTATIPSP